MSIRKILSMPKTTSFTHSSSTTKLKKLKIKMKVLYININLLASIWDFFRVFKKKLLITFLLAKNIGDFEYCLGE